MASRSSQLIIVLIAVLLAVLAGSGIVLWVFNNRQPATVPTPLADETASPLSADSTNLTVPGDGATFNTTVLRSSSYNALDVQLVTSGALPVQPPAVVGKANPFL